MFHVNAETFLPVIGVIFALLICSAARMFMKHALRIHVMKLQHKFREAENRNAARTAEKLYKAGVPETVIIAIVSTKDACNGDVHPLKTISDKGNTKE